MEIPRSIIGAVNALLAPYGEAYSSISAPPSSKGFTDWKGAAKYVGCSAATIRRAVIRGELPPPKKLGVGYNGCVAISIESLDKWVESKPDAVQR